ncbi:ABC transporter ATP-binding protein [Streptomyces spirodelae]|uniref:ATP-binding cassette domain-containing protein n=1 Tax=Streptomyces spirodelae TaxID=2812904 RepID=A0ABS3WQE8_9ACTN|nr:oligopeptide/dipeptide ABC transporter ATP-binding protein [Streptomyces spirodelae]MBO8185244.1 ATP-binding cassette domain-containing protein [Streptomyces spirodelae]
MPDTADTAGTAQTAGTADTVGTADRAGTATGGPLLQARGLTKTFRVPRSASGSTRLHALDGVDLTVRRGETLGLVGESGCGKSTLARVLLMLERPDAGTLRYDGVDPFALRGRSLLAWRRRVQMVFQDPFASLNPRMSAGELIAEPWRSHPDLVPRAERERRVHELLEKVGLRAADARRHPQEFSGGQRQRIGIARALALDPEVIVCDEPVSALDLSVQAQVLNVLTELQAELGVAYVFISHDLPVVRHMADRVAVMYLGRVVESGPAEEVFTAPRHPYTASLLSAAPRPPTAQDDGPSRRIVLFGEVPSPTDPPSGCRFRTRCWKAEQVCATAVPADEPAPDGPQHLAACHLPIQPSDRGGSRAAAHE